MIVDQSEHLRTWLSDVLQPLCDADPHALAKYVLALIRKDKEEAELKQCMIDQLDVFLQLETKGFVSRLFKVLKTKEYLPGVKPTPMEVDTSIVNEEKARSGSSTRVPDSITHSDEDRSNHQTVVEKASVSDCRNSRKDIDIRDRARKGKSRSPRRSRSRGRKSRSPREYRPLRYRPKIMQNKRYDNREREVWDRRRSPGARNRSNSPRRTPPRYRRPFNSRSRSRSPRSPGKDSVAGRFVDPSTQDNKETKPAVQSVIQHAGLDGKSESNKNEFKGVRCRDYDEKGLCMMGDLCPYDHGGNPVILEDVNMKQEEYQVDVAMQYPSRLIRPRPMFDGSLVDGVGWAPQGFRPRHMMIMGRPAVRPGMMRFPQPPPPRLLVDVPVVGAPATQAQDIGVDMSLRGMPRGHMRGFYMGRGRGRGGFDRSRLGAKPMRNNCSLEVKKIPREKNTIAELNSHFWKFGKIINIQIHFEGDPEAALITFSAPEEAYLAYKSTDAVMNNRFIRVFWHNKEKENEEGTEPEAGPAGRLSVKDRLGEHQSEFGMEPMEDEKIIVSGNSLTKTVYNYPPTAKREMSAEKLEQVEAIKKSQEMLAAQENLRKAQEEKQKEAIKLMNNLKSRKGDMLREQLEQQKKLITKLEENKATMSKEEKSQLMSLITSLQESIESIKKDLDELSKPPIPTVRNKMETQKEILDAELDLYNRELEGGDTIALQNKVFELRAQVHASGIFKRGRGGFRGSARGFGLGLRGRGGRLSVGSMRNLRSVDRRTTKICITGYPVSRHSDVLTSFGQFGAIESFEPNLEVPSLVINYQNRKVAELAMSKGKVFDGMNLDIQWVAKAPAPPLAGIKNHTTNGEASQPEEMENAGSTEDDNDESGDLYEDQARITNLYDHYDDEEEEDTDRSWRR